MTGHSTQTLLGCLWAASSVLLAALGEPGGACWLLCTEGTPCSLQVQLEAWGHGKFPRRMVEASVTMVPSLPPISLP